MLGAALLYVQIECLPMRVCELVTIVSLCYYMALEYVAIYTYCVCLWMTQLTLLSFILYLIEVMSRSTPNRYRPGTCCRTMHMLRYLYITSHLSTNALSSPRPKHCSLCDMWWLYINSNRPYFVTWTTIQVSNYIDASWQTGLYIKPV